MSAQAEVAIVIPTWNSAALLPRLLESIAIQEVAIELLAVDNGSADGTVELLRERDIPHITLGRNRGFAHAIDLGAERTAAPFVMPLNADTELESGSVAALIAALVADPGLGGAQPRILQLEDGPARDPGTARLYSAGMALTRDGRALETAAGEPQAATWLRPREIFGVCGAACLLRRELFSVLGGYDESFFSFYEDVDLNVRARVAGWRFSYVPAAAVWHRGNVAWRAGFERPGAENARLVARNRIVTQARFVPAAALPRIAGAEAGALVRAARQRRALATLRGKLEGLLRLRRALRERRSLAAEGDLRRARVWLGAG